MIREDCLWPDFSPTADRLWVLVGGIKRHFQSRTPPEVMCDWLEEQGATNHEIELISTAFYVQRPIPSSVAGGMTNWKNLTIWFGFVADVWRTRQWTSKNTIS